MGDARLVNGNASGSRVPPAIRRVLRAGGWWFRLGVALVLAVDLNLLAKAWFYPTQYVHGAVCTCGQPGWVAYWGAGLLGLFAVAGVLLVVGAIRMRRDWAEQRSERIRTAEAGGARP